MAILYLDDQINPDATLHEVELAIHALDSARHTLVVVELPSGKYLTIGGGPDRFVTELSEEDYRTQWAVIDPTRGEEPTNLVVGGQLVDYPARLCVDIHAVLAAARAFVSQDGARNQDLTWSVET
jgi:hypothetical protein